MTYIKAELRQLVVDRAGGCCEYCRLSQDDGGFAFHFEHIIAEKHGGETSANNLCFSCPSCNLYKGSDISSVDPLTKRLTALFNPRTDKWEQHFSLIGGRLEPLTPEGRVTAFLLHLNRPEAIIERNSLITLGRYPCSPTVIAS